MLVVFLIVAAAILLGGFIVYALPDEAIKPLLWISICAILASIMIVAWPIIQKKTIYLAVLQGVIVFTAGLSTAIACVVRLVAPPRR